MKVPFLDLKSPAQAILPEVMEEMAEVISNTQFIGGPAVVKFEEEFANFCGSKYGVGVNSGTDALHLAVRALGVGPGDDVLVPANTFIATAIGVSLAGARPVPVEISDDTYHVTEETLAAAFTPKTKAIIPVHLYGRVCDMDGIQRFADEKKNSVH